jgi:hypothetical protein
LNGKGAILGGKAVFFLNPLRIRRGDRSTVDVSLVNKELARAFQDLVKSIFKKRVRRPSERPNGDGAAGDSLSPGSSSYSR